jgi:GNAT superfamily N-acetyltransferase
VRLAEPGDLAAVEAIVEAAYSPYVPLIGREPMPMTADYAALIGDGRVHVAGEPGAVVGVLVLVPEPEAMLIENVCVAPAVKGQGVGRLLLEFAEAAARAASYDRIRLYTNAAFTWNVALYERIGYRETGRAGEAPMRRVDMVKALI